MTIDEVRIAHKELESDIRDLINEFNWSTGMGVVSINISRTEVRQINGESHFFSEIEVEVKL